MTCPLDPLFAIIQHAAFLAATIEQRKMVLHSRDLVACLAENLVGTLDFLDVMVRNAYALHLTTLQQGYQARRPAR